MRSTSQSLKLTSLVSGRGNKWRTEKASGGTTSVLWWHWSLSYDIPYWFHFPSFPIFFLSLPRDRWRFHSARRIFCKLHMTPRVCNLVSTWTKPLCAIYQRKTERSNLVNPAELLYSAHHKTSVLLRDVQIILNIKKNPHEFKK